MPALGRASDIWCALLFLGYPLIPLGLMALLGRSFYGTDPIYWVTGVATVFALLVSAYKLPHRLYKLKR